ncbi:hypothetical protein Athai_40000 [Actinocatenispora thailandica]|uniref:Uncharacterized protein n=1 Tax=Actinocatenispora thailandica TaxID=227318 RepID=A0A7R7DS26_9ACTN|nr:hypothetical protein [Actinocatenispora thailandica]BCJ36497.1 hypothetical protein Athai_40000 [Actinocatenispora thailandica]
MSQPTTHRLTDERLAWLAVRDHFAAVARRLGVLGTAALILAFLGGGGRSRGAMVADDQRHAMTGKLGDYAFAVDDAARTLNKDERARLRATGEVPDWFVADVERRFKELRKR